MEVNIRHEYEGLKSADRLVAATIHLWATHGNAGISARLLGQAANLPVSSIYHHFGALEQLYETTQERVRSEAERWCDARLDSFADAGALTPDALPAMLAALIDDWTQDQRPWALVWRECQIMAARDARYVPALRGWQALWQRFWQEICARCGLGPLGELTALLFVGESQLHLMQWRRPIDRSCLDETCAGWSNWLAGRLTPEGPWRHFARTEALREMPELALRSEAIERIANAAAGTVEELGMAGLTHRAVAARAGLTLGVVSYNFRTSADLTRAAFEMIYRRIVPDNLQQAPTIPDAATAFEGMTGYDLLAPRLAAIDEVMASVARDPGLRPFAPQLRYLRGRSSGVQLQGLLGPGRPTSPADAALISAISAGQRHACIGMTREEVRAYLERTLGTLLSVLGVERP